MRRILLVSCISLLPGLALAQSTANPPPAGMDQSVPAPSPAPGMMGDDWGTGPDMMSGGWGKDRRGFGQGDVLMKFYAANTTHDGHLTLAQAQAAGFKPVVDNFNDIDVAKRGYVTFYDIMAWRMDDMAKRLEQRADELRAKD